MMRLTVIRKENFNAAHRLHNDQLSDQENADLFGKCNSPNYHGHNYDLELHVTGEIDEKTGYVIDLKYLSEIVKDEVLSKFDHKNLNLDIDEFKKVNPTAENIAVVIYNKVKAKLDDRYELKVHLHETEKNSVVFPV